MKLNISPMKLDVAQAVPLGLILNEAISNSIKYAFKKMTNGIITITLTLVDEERYSLSIADNGIGLPAGFDLSNTNSLGMRLMHGLSDQLEADLFLENDIGLRVSITFKPLFLE